MEQGRPTSPNNTANAQRPRARNNSKKQPQNTRNDTQRLGGLATTEQIIILIFYQP